MENKLSKVEARHPKEWQEVDLSLPKKDPGSKPELEATSFEFAPVREQTKRLAQNIRIVKAPEANTEISTNTVPLPRASLTPQTSTAPLVSQEATTAALTPIEEATSIASKPLSVFDRVVNWLAKKLTDLVNKFLSRFKKNAPKTLVAVGKTKKDRKLRWYQRLYTKKQSRAKSEDDWASGI